MSLIEVGFFKSLVKVYQAEEQEYYINNTEDLLLQIEELIKVVYQTETNQEYDFSLKELLKIIGVKGCDQQAIAMLKKFKSIVYDQAGLGKLKISQMLRSYCFDRQLSIKMNETTICKVRLYMIEGFNFAKKDLFSLSDPYLYIRSGKTVFNEVDNYQLDTAEPKFFKCYEFMLNFPGAKPLEIIAYDYDPFFGDE